METQGIGLDKGRKGETGNDLIPSKIKTRRRPCSYDRNLTACFETTLYMYTLNHEAVELVGASCVTVPACATSINAFLLE